MPIHLPLRKGPDSGALASIIGFSQTEERRPVFNSGV